MFSKRKGLTLVEMVVAAGIIAIVFSMAADIIIQIIHANRKIAIQRQVMLEARNSLETITREARLAMGRVGPDAIKIKGAGDLELNLSANLYKNYKIVPVDLSQPNGDQVIQVQEGNIETTAGSSRPDLDIMLVLDTTGSMRESGGPDGTKLEYLKVAAKSFVDIFSQQEATDITNQFTDRIGIVAFSTKYVDGAQLLNGLTDASGFGNLKTTINSLSPNGNTPLSSGIFKATNELKDFGRPDPAIKIEIVLSDGMANQEGDGTPSCGVKPVDSAICESGIGWGEGITFYSIGLGTPGSGQLDVRTLQSIATVPGSDPPKVNYYGAQNGEYLTDIFSQIAGEISAETDHPDPPYNLTSEKINVKKLDFVWNISSAQPYVIITLQVQSKNYDNPDTKDWQKADITLESVISSRDYQVVAP